ncbi:MAG: hypothetical protein AUK44_08425 [Porphyromonadaceae bacterium CG2_30_38_12]|nr:MAG: hypothetical protein AUK44_08425 [Porphyromonadaceae bacterium CG2_30_38_12]
MFKAILSNSGFYAKISQLILVLIVAILFSSILTALFTEGSMEDVANLRIAQIIQSLFLFVATPLILAFFWSEKPLHYLHLSTKSNPTSYLLVVLIAIIAIPFINFLGELNKQIALPHFLSAIEIWMKDMETQMEILIVKLLTVSTLGALLFNLFLIAVLPALGEELFFRGILQKLFTEWRKPILAIWLAAFIFSSIHLQFYGFIPRLLLGAFFGYLVLWSGNLWLPIVAHFTNNSMGILFFYLKNKGEQLINLDTIGTGNTIYMAFLSLGLLLLLIKKLRSSLTQS